MKVLIFSAVADTHTALWFLFEDPRLSSRVRQFIAKSIEDDAAVAVSAVSLAEVVYLVEKGRVARSAYDELTKALASPEHVFAAVPFSLDAVSSMWNIGRDKVPDMPDRLIACTALSLGVPLLTKDAKIRASNLQTIW